MPIKIIKDSITRKELFDLAKDQFGDFVKAVVDIEKEIMAVGGELHADEEIVLIEEESSKREFVWGINIYPDKSGDDFIEFDSMINLKPQYGNRSRGIEHVEIQNKIRAIVNKLVHD